MHRNQIIDGEHRLLTETEAARRLQVCAKTLYHARRRGELRFVRLGNCIRYDPADLEKFIERQKRQGDHGAPTSQGESHEFAENDFA